MAADIPQHAVRDGDVRVIYVAANHGLYKFWPDTNEVALMKAIIPGTEQGHKVGYAGIFHEPPLPEPEPGTEYLMSTAGDSPGGVWHYANGVWTLKTGNLPYSTWGKVIASPRNPNHWAVMAAPVSNVGGYFVGPSGIAPIWVTSDAGANWIGLTLPTTVPYPYKPIDAMEFADDADELVWPALMGGGKGFIYRATLDGAVTTHSIASGSVDIAHGGVVDHGSVYWYNDYGAAVEQRSGAVTGVQRIAGERESYFEWFGIGKGLVHNNRESGSGGRILVAADYSANPINTIIVSSTPVNSVTAAAGNVYATSWGNGIRRFSNVLGSISDSGWIATPAVGNAGYIRNARQQRETVTNLAIRRGGTKDLYISQDGAAWTVLDGPASAVNLSGYVEVITRL